MEGANPVRQKMADRCAMSSGYRTNGPLGNPLDPALGWQTIEALTVGTKRFKLCIFTGDGRTRRFQTADFNEERAVKPTFGFKDMQSPVQIGLRHLGRQQKTVIIHRDDGKPMRSFSDEAGDLI